jgi:alpha,alpha-trehalase
VARYRVARDSSNFSLHSFVQQHFRLPASPGGGAEPARAGADTLASASLETHLHALWPLLTRPPDTIRTRSSLIPLPHAYVVPGGRFREVYYWDSYFTMLGLVASDRLDLVRGMLDNFAHLVGCFGHVPNGNRTYYLSRSQPPYLGAMVGLLAAATDTASVLGYLPALEAEHAFWMEGAESLPRGEASRRVVRMRDGALQPLLG